MFFKKKEDICQKEFVQKLCENITNAFFSALIEYAEQSYRLWLGLGEDHPALASVEVKIWIDKIDWRAKGFIYGRSGNVNFADFGIEKISNDERGKLISVIARQLISKIEDSDIKGHLFRMKIDPNTYYSKGRKHAYTWILYATQEKKYARYNNINARELKEYMAKSQNV